MTKHKMRILLAEKSSFSEKGIAALLKLGNLDAQDLTQEELLDHIPDYDVLVVRLGLRVDSIILGSAANLKIIVTPTTGLDHIDLAAATQKGIHVLSLKGERSFLDTVYSTAEHAFGLLMALVRHIPSSFDAVTKYHWRRDVYRGRELDGKIIGLIGCGRLGSMMVRYARAFGMQVLVYDPYQENLPDEIELVETLDELLSRSDIISLHIPLNHETRGMISETEFLKMKHGAFLVNTSRGAIIEETAFLEALKSGQLAGAALDVVCNEHMIETERYNPLIAYAQENQNLIITPHIGGATFESVEKADIFIVNKLFSWLENVQ
jgi:D-3-phosphoglycerate dehydrogenase